LKDRSSSPESKNCVKRAESEFSWSKIAAEIGEVYGRLSPAPAETPMSVSGESKASEIVNPA